MKVSLVAHAIWVDALNRSGSRVCRVNRGIVPPKSMREINAVYQRDAATRHIIARLSDCCAFVLTSSLVIR